MRRGFALAVVCLLGIGALAACASASSTPPHTAGSPSPTPGPTLAAGQQSRVEHCNHQEALITEPPALHGPAPAAVYVHGGSSVSGDYDTGGFVIDSIGPAPAQRELGAGSPHDRPRA